VQESVDLYSIPPWREQGQGEFFEISIPEGEDNMLLRNVEIRLPAGGASYPGRKESSKLT
jgi:hypothetical protein